MRIIIEGDRANAGKYIAWAKKKLNSCKRGATLFNRDVVTPPPFKFKDAKISLKSVFGRDEIRIVGLKGGGRMTFFVKNTWDGIVWINGNPLFGKVAWCGVTQEIISRGNSGSFFAYNPYTEEGREVALNTTAPFPPTPYTPAYFRSFTIIDNYAYYVDYGSWAGDPVLSAIVGKVNLSNGDVEDAASFPFGVDFNETNTQFYGMTNDGTNIYVAGSAVAPKTISKVKLNKSLSILSTNKNSYNTLSTKTGWHYNPKDGQIYMVDVQGGDWVASVNPDDLEDYNYLLSDTAKPFLGLNVIGRQSWIVPDHGASSGVDVQESVWLDRSLTGEGSYQPQKFSANSPLSKMPSEYELNNYTKTFLNPDGLRADVDQWILISKGQTNSFFLYKYTLPYKLVEIGIIGGDN